MARLLTIAVLLVWLVPIWAGRRPPSRIADWRRELLRDRRPGPTQLCGKAAELVAGLGRRARALLGRPEQRDADRVVGLVLTLGGMVVLVDPLLAGLTVASVGLGLRLRRRLAAMRRRRGLASALPDTIDLLCLGAEAGLSVPHVIDATVEHGQGPVVDRLATARRMNQQGVRLAEALEPIRSEPSLTTLADALIDAERYGSPLVRTLERLALDARASRRQQAEQAIRKLPVRMLLPLVLCVLPALGALAVVPIVAVTLQGFEL